MEVYHASLKIEHTDETLFVCTMFIYLGVRILKEWQGIWQGNITSGHNLKYPFLTYPTSIAYISQSILITVKYFLNNTYILPIYVNVSLFFTHFLCIYFGL